MALQAYYDLENNYNDTSGNANHGAAVGAGIVFIQQDPKPSVGSYCAKTFTDANCMSLPTDIFDNMIFSGKIKLDFFIPYGAANGKIAIGSTHGIYGYFYVRFFNTGYVQVAVPTSGTTRTFDSAAGLWKYGRWYTLRIKYDADGLEVFLKDQAGGAESLIIDQTPIAGVVPQFDSPAALAYVGRAANTAGVAFEGMIDNVEFGSGPDDADYATTNDTMVFASTGHSYVVGYSTADANGYRKSAYESWRDTYARSYYFGGLFNVGDILTPHHSGINGWKIADVDTNITTNILPDAFDYPGENHVILIGPIEYNDMVAGTPLATFNASFQSVINAIDTWSPDIKIFLVVGPETPTSIAAYAAEVRTVYADALIAGKNVYLIDLFDIGIVIGGDNIHPEDSPAGYGAMGEYIADQVDAQLFPVPPTPISARLITQYKNASNLIDIIAGFGEQTQDDEDMLQAFFLERYLATAIGAQLDGLGQIIGINRGVLNDADYRARLYLQIAQNFSEGAIENLIWIYKELMGADSIILSEIFPAEFSMLAINPAPIADPTTIRDAVFAAKAAGVGSGFLAKTNAAPYFAFLGVPGDTAGFNAGTFVGLI